MAQDTATATSIVASGTTWAQLKTGGYRAVLDNLVSTNTAKADPTTTATVSATGGGSSGGLLQVGSTASWYFVYTFCDAFGETLGGGRSTATSVATTNIPRVTLPSKPTGVAFMNLYLGTVSGSETLYATGITATTFDCSYAAWADPGMTLPAVNTTGAAVHHDLLYSILDANGSFKQQRYSDFLSSYLRGDAIERRDYYRELHKEEGILRAWLTLVAEVRVLVAANPGTLAWSTGGGLNGSVKRTFS